MPASHSASISEASGGEIHRQVVCPDKILSRGTSLALADGYG
jgi:hypothetical protein